MSQRTIAEFNHDYAHAIRADPDGFVQAIGYALNSGASEAWEELEHFGVRRAVQCHHSDDRKAVVNRHEYPL